MRNKEFEIEVNGKLYLGTYSFSDNKLFIEECFRHECDERNIESQIEIDSLNNEKEFLKVYMALEKETADERMDEAEYNYEARYSIGEDKADEKRKA